MIEEDLTNAETLRVDRLRRKEKQFAAAQRWEVALAEYIRWEAGADSAPRVRLRGLDIGEYFFVRRIRMGLSRAQVGRALGKRPDTVMGIERGLSPPIPDLVELFK